MRVEYTTTLDDYEALCRHTRLKAGFNRLSYLYTWLVLPLLILTIAALLIVYTPYWIVGICFAAYALSYAVVFPVCVGNLSDTSYRLALKRAGTKGVVGPITLILTDESLVEITEVTNSAANWQCINGISETDDHPFIYVTAQCVAILPRDEFDTDAEYEAVRDFAMSRFMSAVERAKSISDQAEVDA